MAAEQKLQWIALPGGVGPDGRLRLAAFVSPRLRCDGGRLAELPDFVDWPARLVDAAWTVHAAGTAVPATPAGPAPDSALWTALFPPETVVRTFAFADYADRPLVTFGIAPLLRDLRQLYSGAAVHGTDLLPLEPREEDVPRLDLLLRPFTQVLEGRFGGSPTPEDRQSVLRHLLDSARGRAADRRARGQRGQPTPIEPLPAAEASEAERALLFHSRPDREPTEMPANGTHYRDAVDFHRMLGALGDHPDLLRRLGLVVDLTVDPTDLPTAPLGNPGWLEVVPGLVPAAAPDEVTRMSLSHRTAYLHDDVAGDDPDHGTVFMATRRTPDPLGPAGGVPTGLVPLPESAFMLNQVDVDGAVIKAVNLAATVTVPASSTAERPLGQPEETGLPALRTAGLALVHTGRAESLQQQFSQALDHDATAEQDVPVELYAEDLVRGHRVDILDTTTGHGTWRSLHARTLTARVQRYRGTLEPLPGEGFVQLSLAGPAVPPGATPDPTSEVYVHQAMLTWDGWSLSAPRPGAALNRDPRAPDAAEPDTAPVRPANDPHTSMGLSLESSVAPGTLPKLRIGHAYRLRLREVDLAGQGPTLEEADSWLRSPAAATPALPAQASAPYLRFEPVLPPSIVPAQVFGEGASLLRLVVRSDVDLDPVSYASATAAERTGMGMEPYAPHDDRHVVPPKASFEAAERHGMFDAVMSSDGTEPSGERRAQLREAYALARREKGTFDDPDAPGAQVVEIPATGDRPPARYVVRSTPTVEVPYLPDPLADGVVFFGLPGTGPEGLRIDVAGPQWHSPRPFRLRLTGGEEGTEWDEAERVLTVRLPQARTARARVASAVDRLDVMGLVSWCEQELAGDELDRAITAMRENRSWLVTPWHEIEMVHAVQHPLLAPELELQLQRGVGQTWVDLSGSTRIHADSTDKIELEARWTEDVDLPEEVGPRTMRAASEVFTLPVSLLRTVSPDDERASFRLLDDELVEFHTGRREHQDGGHPTPHEFGDTKHRLVEYTMSAASAFREDFPADWLNAADRTMSAGRPVTLDVPSSARPPAPGVLYCVPTLGWDSTAGDGRAEVRRRGGGLRVWLRRGWFGSGDGELLGVVLGSALVSPQESEYHTVSLVGADPTRRGSVPETLRAETFRNALVVSAPLRLPGETDPVTVVGFAPEFHQQSQRWFCDIDVDTGTAYQPFLRLAFVRYQPSSLPTCHLSQVVLADLVQILPDRNVTVVSPGDDPASRDVTVAGPSYDAIAVDGVTRTDQAMLSRMTVRIQRRDARIADEQLGWADLEDTVVELAASRAGGEATWTGRITPPSAAGPLRLLVLEEERWAADEAVAGPGRTVAKVVFAAHVPLE